jgi:hypothetical protein
MFSLDIYNLEMPSVPSVYLLQVDANSVTAASEFITNLEQLDLNSTVLAAVNHNSLKEVNSLLYSVTYDHYIN